LIAIHCPFRRSVGSDSADGAPENVEAQTDRRHTAPPVPTAGEVEVWRELPFSIERQGPSIQAEEIRLEGESGWRGPRGCVTKRVTTQPCVRDDALFNLIVRSPTVLEVGRRASSGANPAKGRPPRPARGTTTRATLIDPFSLREPRSRSGTERALGGRRGPRTGQSGWEAWLTRARRRC